MKPVANKPTPSTALEDELATLQSQLEDAAEKRREREREKPSSETPGTDQDNPGNPAETTREAKR